MFSFLCKNRIQINPKMRDYCIKSTNESIRKLSEKYNQERTVITKEDSSKSNYIDLIISFLSSMSLLSFFKQMFFLLLPSSYYFPSLSDQVDDTRISLRYCLPRDLFSIKTILVKTNTVEDDNLVVVKPLSPKLAAQGPVLGLDNIDNIEHNYDVINIVDGNIDSPTINVETDKKTISNESSSNVNSKILMDWLITDFSQELR